ncbi:MAG: dipicolinate synthase subunit DpsA [Clostridia bacterium]|nr:dipicolinate synthase subunit DpsA [Clostridia bacterium]
MRREWNVWVVGGDMRQTKLAELLADDGHTVHTYALDKGLEEGMRAERDLSGASLADCVVLPLPAGGEGGTLNAPLAEEKTQMETVFAALRPGQVVCAGKVDHDLMELGKAHGLLLFDYFAREELAVANAVPTAEGAVQIAMEELPVTLHRARVLVLGFGRVAKLVAHRFHALGARVSVAARKWADLAWAEAYGYEVEHIERLDGWLCAYDLVINTVPHRVLDEGRLDDLRPGCLVIDLASKPGGVDFEAAARLGVKCIWALSLPGKVAPVTSGKIIRDTIYHIFDELEQGV